MNGRAKWPEELPARLSTPVPRERIHRQRIQCTAYRREDGLWEFEAELSDNSAADPSEPDAPAHHLAVRVLAGDDLVIRDVQVSSDTLIHTLFPSILDTAEAGLRRIKGMRIGAGVTTLAQDPGDACTHTSTLLRTIAATATQSMASRSSGPTSGEMDRQAPSPHQTEIIP